MGRTTARTQHDLSAIDVGAVTPYLERCSFPAPGTPVTCAVSGGADSTALLLLAIAAGCVPRVVHVDHGLRPESPTDAAHVRDLCAALDVTVDVVTVKVAPGANLEERARQARAEVLPDDALLGHTADDQAETLLLNLLRGAGPTGMAAMPADGRRPILALRRVETAAICEHAGVEPRVDAMNADPAFRRVRVRRELMPLLDDIAERDVAAVLVRSAALFAEVDALIRDAHADVDPTDVAALRAVPEVVARSALRDWARAVSGAPHPPDMAALERMMAVVRGEVVATQVPGGWCLRRSRGRLRLEQPDRDR